MSARIHRLLLSALLLGLAVLATGLAGCAAPADKTSAVPETETLSGQPPAGAFHKDGQLLLQYRAGGEMAYLAATWPGGGESAGRHRYQTTLLSPLADAPPDPQVLQRDWQAVTLRDHQQWRNLLRTLLEQSTPNEQGSGTLVTIQGADFVLSRDAAGKMQVVRLEDKPAGLQIVRSISEESFAARADAYLTAELAGEGKPPGPLLFVAGEDDGGGAFVFFDLATRQSVLLMQPANALAFDGKLGFSLRLVDAIALRSHLLGTLKNPLTTTSRLITLTAHSGAVLVPRGPGAGTAPGPLSGGSGMDLTQWEQHLDERVAGERYRGSLTPLIDGEAFFVSLIQAIQDARESVDIQVYIFDSDDYALRIADLLKRRSHEVRVRVLVDRLGSMAAAQVPANSPYTARSKPPLSIAGYLREGSAIEVRALDNPWLTSDHTKAVIVDRQMAYIGGMNIGREYRYEWHDLMVKVEGPVVGRLQGDFERRWAFAGVGGDVARAFAGIRAAPVATAGANDDSIDIRPLYTRTGDAQILRAQLAAIRRAKSHIYIEQPYVTDDEMISELIAARRRGIDVRVILPGRGDSGLMNRANRIAANAFLAGGVRVYAYPGMSHVKAAIYDGWACVGSANFDKLSLRINQETNLATSEPRFVEPLRRDLFEADFARSRELTAPQPVKWTDYMAEFITDQL